MARLVLVRHGKTDWNKISRIQGTCDIPLNEDGKNDALRMANELSGLRIDVVYSSSLSRSYETAETIAAKHNLKIKKLKALAELNQGVWQGLCINDIKKRYRKQYTLWRQSPISSKPPQGESMKDAYTRVVSTVQKILEKHSQETVCIVSHEVVISLLKCYLKRYNLENIWNAAPKTASWEIIDLEAQSK